MGAVKRGYPVFLGTEKNTGEDLYLVFLKARLLNVLIAGGPGSGKTTLMQNLLEDLLSRNGRDAIEVRIFDAASFYEFRKYEANQVQVDSAYPERSHEMDVDHVCAYFKERYDQMQIRFSQESRQKREGTGTAQFPECFLFIPGFCNILTMIAGYGKKKGENEVSRVHAVEKLAKHLECLLKYGSELGIHVIAEYDYYYQPSEACKVEGLFWNILLLKGGRLFRHSYQPYLGVFNKSSVLEWKERLRTGEALFCDHYEMKVQQFSFEKKG